MSAQASGVHGEAEVDIVSPLIEEFQVHSLLDEEATASGPASEHKRPYCERCFRAKDVCLCSALPEGAPLNTKSRIVLLIHPKEVRRALGTAPLLRCCLQNLIIKEGDRFPEPEDDPDFHRALTAGGSKPYLVCPGPGAEELRAPVSKGGSSSSTSKPPSINDDSGTGTAEKGDADNVESSPPRTLIFIDGKWSQAKSMVNRSTWLMETLPRVVLVPTEQSGYTFRKQPAEGCLSTLEAVAEALLALEGPRGPELKAALIKPFRRMVEQQCGYIPEGQEDKNARFTSAEEVEAGVAALKVALEEAQATAAAAASAAAATTTGGGGGEGDPPSNNSSVNVVPKTAREPAVHCIVRWGERGITNREVVVVEVLWAPLDQVKFRARSLSEGRSRGCRFWVLPPSKLPEGARYEALPNADSP
eukprot:CAMPEP_0206575126 /NCGR_PEP_ID=MMETSP0325_2-20121206/29874_1 /ASSEMBLY_ACC=CAM_ASM_000347 /TAXON_ID=2866 /ORGANISM="Crypthecodinium cohnii, Strain Seligo" /LENGTH=417 /DNA_ID=CAMNT_0054079899 /DNA_START=62 /DNA_END=1315 /DNA_ORIENTATION=-